MFLQYLINGLLLGGVYVLIGVGFSLVYGVMSIINLAHGSLIMLGAYITYTCFAALGVDPFLSLFISAGMMFVIGYLMQYFVINRVVKASLGMTVVLTFGIDLILKNIAQFIWSADFKSITPSNAGRSFEVGSAVIPYVRFTVFVTAILTTVLMFLFLNKTKLGKGIRATSLNREAAGLMGLNINIIYAVTFGIGSAIAGVAGGLFGMIYSIYPNMGATFLGKAFAVAVLGGLGNVAGAIIGGLILGLVELFGAWGLGAAYQNAIGYIVILIVLILRPQGVLGKQFS
jgi:branched-chain amino acid transport system permease protein